jgi:dTDP-4-amino-4,6-dideoxygalactose transaminase
MTTAGEGGMVTTNNKALWGKVWSFKDHGKSWAAIYEKQHPPGFRWLHESFGTNWRMLEMQAAVGLKQLEKMPIWTEKRNKYSQQIFDTAMGFSALRVPQVPIHIEHAFYKCYVFVEPDKLNTGWNRDRIIAELNTLDVPCFSGSCSEVYKEKAFDNTGYRPKETLSNAVELGATSLMFLVHPTLKQAEINKCCNALAQVMESASKGKHQ